MPTLPLPAPITTQPQRRSRRPVERVDLSVALSGQVTMEVLRQVIAAALGDDLIELQLIDMYAGEMDTQRRRSVTFRAILLQNEGHRATYGSYCAQRWKSYLTSTCGCDEVLWDNAAMESFFATPKAELPVSVFESHAAARSEAFDYIERFYNRQRLHSTLGQRSRMTPCL